MEKIQILKQNSLFKNVPISYLPKIIEYFQKLNFEEDEVLFKEGSYGDNLYLIGDGVVSIILEIDSIGQEGIAVLKKSDFFGEMSVLDKGTRSATAKARKGAILLKIEEKDFKKLIDKESEYSNIILKNIVEKINFRIKDTSSKLNSFYLMGMEG